MVNYEFLLKFEPILRLPLMSEILNFRPNCLEKIKISTLPSFLRYFQMEASTRVGHVVFSRWKMTKLLTFMFFVLPSMPSLLPENPNPEFTD